MSPVKGATRLERDLARAGQRCENRAELFAARIETAATGREAVSVACDYLKAVAKNCLTDEERWEWARELAALADGRNHQ